MVSQIQKDKNKKNQRRVYLIIGTIAYIYLVLAILHFNALRVTNPRLGMGDAINQGMINVIAKPLDIFPITGTIIMWIAAVSVIGGMMLVMIITDKQLRKHDNPDTVNGEAHLMNASELEEYNKKRTDPIGEPVSTGKNNMILSRDIKLALDGTKTRRNCNVLVIGGSGAGKSRFFAAPNILQYNSNFVITDPSGEMLNDYGKALEDNGYKVLVFNLTDVYRGNRYNPFHYIKEEKDVYLLVETLIKNTTPPESHSGDPFWENSEKLLLTALILYLWHERPEEEQTFNMVARMVDMAEIDENDASAESPLDILFKDLEEKAPENLAVQQYHSFKIGAGKTLKSILISVAVRLRAFKLSDIKYLTDVDEFEFEKFADTKQALFVIIPTADSTFNFLVSLMYSQLFTSLYTYVETRAVYGWEAYMGETDIVKVEQAYSKEESDAAKKKIQSFIKDVKAGTVIKLDKNKKLYKIYTKKKKTLVAWRGTKSKAEKLQEQLKELRIRPCPRKCPNHVRLILDEFANIGQIPDFDQKLATIRKYEISCSIILQAISQLKDLYEKKWNTLAANCDTKLFLGCDDLDTIEWLLKMLGKKTTTVENMTFQANGGGSTGLNKSSLELLTIDQVTMMADDECIVRVRGERPYYGKKYELTKHPNYEYAHKKSGMFEIPLSKEAAINRNAGPLRLRGQKEQEQAEKEAKAEDEKSSVQKEPPKDMKNAQNQSRKKDAEAAAAALKNMDAGIPKETDDMINMALMNGMGLNPSSTDAEIKEAIESMIELDNPSMETIAYNMTN